MFEHNDLLDFRNLTSVYLQDKVRYFFKEVVIN